VVSVGDGVLIQNSNSKSSVPSWSTGVRWRAPPGSPHTRGAPQRRSCMLEEGKSHAPHYHTNFLLVLPLHLTLYSFPTTLLPLQPPPLPYASITVPALPPSHSWLRLCLLYHSAPPTSSIAPRYGCIAVSSPRRSSVPRPTVGVTVARATPIISL
jgi:hypothetical protein